MFIRQKLKKTGKNYILFALQQTAGLQRVCRIMYSSDEIATYVFVKKFGERYISRLAVVQCGKNVYSTLQY
jgi:hypothetical protein